MDLTGSGSDTLLYRELDKSRTINGNILFIWQKKISRFVAVPEM